MSEQPSITLTPRQQRALRHLARRHMHRPRITRRRMFADYTSLPVGTLEDESVQDRFIAPDKEAGQAAPSQPVASNISPMPALAELSRPLNAPIPSKDNSRGRPLVPAARKIPPMPPLPMRRASVPVPAQQKHGIISTDKRQYPYYHTLTQQQKRLGRRTRKHLRQVRVNERLARLRFWATIWSIIGLLMVIFMSLGAIGSATLYDFVQHTQTTYEHQVDTLR